VTGPIIIVSISIEEVRTSPHTHQKSNNKKNSTEKTKDRSLIWPPSNGTCLEHRGKPTIGDFRIKNYDGMTKEEEERRK
jgi:hypothetical protein